MCVRVGVCQAVSGRRNRVQSFRYLCCARGSIVLTLLLYTVVSSNHIYESSSEYQVSQFCFRGYYAGLHY